ncbi:MAG: NINE protein [Haloarculaceae archaeon]
MSAEDPSDDPSDDPDPADDAGEAAPHEKYCHACGAVIRKEAEICPACGVRQHDVQGSGGKDRVTAGVLAILLGWMGAHKFYLGYNTMGVLYLCFFWTGIPAVLGLAEGIIYLLKTDREFTETYVENRKTLF